MSDSKQFSAFMAILIAAVLWGFIGLFSRNLFDAGFTTMQVTAVRMGIGTAVLVVCLALFDRKCFHIRKKDLWIFVVFAIAKLASDVLLFQAQTMIHLSLSTVLQLTSPFYVFLFSIFLFGDRITVKKITAIVIAFVGCLLATGVLEKDIDFNLIGIVCAILSGVAFATYVTGTKLIITKGYSANTTLLYVFVIGTVMIIPFADLGGMASTVVFNEHTLFDILSIGILMTLVPYYLQAYCLKYMDAVKSNIINLIELVVATLVGFVFYGESLGVLNILGLVMIPMAIVLMNLDALMHNPEQKTDRE
ncbi:MAG: DMT family transporter [archaeon]|nr:DMT family transporter [archaeon]